MGKKRSVILMGILRVSLAVAVVLGIQRSTLAGRMTQRLESS